MLQKRGWDCAAACELTKWLHIVREHVKHLPNGYTAVEGRASLYHVIQNVSKLRHAAVHRLHLTPQEFLDQIQSAHMLTEVLHDDKTLKKLQDLYVNVDTQSKRMEGSAKVMEQRMCSTLTEIRRQKSILEAREKELLSYCELKKIEITNAAGQALERSINTLLGDQELESARKKENVSRPDKNNFGVVIEEGDIESDEEWLQAEL